MDRVVQVSAEVILGLLARLEAGGVPEEAPVSLPVLDLPGPLRLP
ncbi:hypothetical protein [Deinococcus budaensis]|uniref:Uncharacterized protein n=1 Tax=Deinococcus budaensis TaxID=1665626 RepID=A0A7W8GCB4_9DEIO|nr:hypothetical protein [Deinococcus budaensis]MBB5232946.1 hypothetical protein [Deinococcus budaensis]